MKTILNRRAVAELILAGVAVILAIIAISPIIYMLITGDYPGAHLFYGLEEDSPPVGFILNLTGH